MHFFVRYGLVIALAAGAPLPAGAAGPIEEIIVTATLRERALGEVPSSIAVLDETLIRSVTLQHFEELASLVPNLNWSGEGSRARYFQIRGTGELEQYEGAPNPSVGFIVDDIDFSDIGGIATLFDTERIEVLRGPQGTRYGANALAGLIYMQTAAPGETPEAYVETSAGSDGTWAVGAAAGGPVPGLDEELGYRVSVRQYQSDGFRDNVFLGRDDTYDRDELTGRARLRWRPDERWQLDLTGLYADLDNGYDAWATDNGFNVYSDKPGKDTQRTRAGSARLTADLSDAVTLVSITGLAESDIVFSFDADWGNDVFWTPDEYDFTQRTDRARRTLNQELRLVSKPAGRLFGGVDWVIGLYGLALDETNRIVDRGLLDLDDAFCAGSDPGFCEPFTADDTLSSDYAATSGALFGEVNVPLGDAIRLTVGLRGERRDADYDDLFEDRVAGISQVNRFEPSDRMWGGEFALTHEFTAATTGYARIARGYKAGGFNPGLARVLPDPDTCQPVFLVCPSQIEFDPEYLWNYEVGLRLTGEARRWWTDLSFFWQDRDDLQVKVPIQFQIGDPNTFIFVTDNAESGRVLGLETELGWQATDALTLYASAGYLETDIERFNAQPHFEGHEFPHAPPYSFAAGAVYQGAEGWFARLDVTGRDGYYYDYDRSEGPDRKSEAAEIVSLRAGREWQRWKIEAWVRNLFDESFTVRGFYFGNEPPQFVETRYTRLGDPRHYGLTVAYQYR